MATNTLQETLKKYFYSGVGLAAHTAEAVQKSVNELVKNGKVNEEDGRRIVSEAIKKVEARRPEIEAKYNETVHKLAKLTTTEMDKLQKRIQDLERQLSMRKAGAASKSTVKSAVKSVAKKAVKKAVSKKTPAKKKSK